MGVEYYSFNVNISVFKIKFRTALVNVIFKLRKLELSIFIPLSIMSIFFLFFFVNFPTEQCPFVLNFGDKLVRHNQ